MVSKNILFFLFSYISLGEKYIHNTSAVDHFHSWQFSSLSIVSAEELVRTGASFVFCNESFSLSQMGQILAQPSLKGKDKGKHVMNCSFPSSKGVKSSDDHLFYAMIDWRLDKKEINLLFEIISIRNIQSIRKLPIRDVPVHYKGKKNM